jgi:hypothetical protein
MRNRSRIIVRALAISAALGLSSCEREPPRRQAILSPAIAPGTLLVEILVERDRGDSFWQYRSTPATGEVALVSSGRHRPDEWIVPRSQSGEARCGKTEALSPNGRLVAACRYPGYGEQTQFELRADDRLVFKWQPSDWRDIDGFVWSPTSTSIALLNHSEARGYGPFDLLWSFAGHPPGHNTFYLTIIDVKSRQSTEYVLRGNVVAGEGKILDWIVNDAEK